MKSEFDVLKYICNKKGFDVRVSDDGGVLVVNNREPQFIDREIWYHFGVCNNDWTGFEDQRYYKDFNGELRDRDVYLVKYENSLFKRQKYFFITHNSVREALVEWYKLCYTNGFCKLDINSEEYMIANKAIIEESGLFHKYDCINDSTYDDCDEEDCGFDE